jgi:hypothetical protein
MCYILKHKCPICGKYDDPKSGTLTECVKGIHIYVHAKEDSTWPPCGMAQTLIHDLYHEECYVHAGDTRERCERVNDQLLYELSEWLDGDQDSIPTQNGGVRYYRPIVSAEHYCPRGTKELPPNTYRPLKKT